MDPHFMNKLKICRTNNAFLADFHNVQWINVQIDLKLQFESKAGLSSRSCCATQFCLQHSPVKMSYLLTGTDRDVLSVGCARLWMRHNVVSYVPRKIIALYVIVLPDQISGN